MAQVISRRGTNETSARLQGSPSLLSLLTEWARNASPPRRRRRRRKKRRRVTVPFPSIRSLRVLPLGVDCLASWLFGRHVPHAAHLTPRPLCPPAGAAFGDAHPRTAAWFSTSLPLLLYSCALHSRLCAVGQGGLGRTCKPPLGHPARLDRACSRPSTLL